MINTNILTSLSSKIVSAILIVALSIATLTVGLSVQASAQSAGRDSLKCGSGVDGFEGGTASCKDISGEGTKVQNLISNIINVISVIVGAVAVIMILFGGFRFVTAGGDTNAVSSAKNTIVYAIVGLIIVAFAQVIVRFVLQRSTENVGG